MLCGLSVILFNDVYYVYLIENVHVWMDDPLLQTKSTWLAHHRQALLHGCTDYDPSERNNNCFLSVAALSSTHFLKTTKKKRMSFVH